MDLQMNKYSAITSGKSDLDQYTDNWTTSAIEVMQSWMHSVDVMVTEKGTTPIRMNDSSLNTDCLKL